MDNPLGTIFLNFFSAINMITCISWSVSFVLLPLRSCVILVSSNCHVRDSYHSIYGFKITNLIGLKAIPVRTKIFFFKKT